MFQNRLKQMIKAGQPAIGSWIAFTDPYAVEVMGEAGFDWLLIDMEHCPIETAGLRTILLALKGSSAVPVVRLMNNQPDHFKVALDLGAQAVMVPMVQSAEDARRAVDSCYYPPRGSRGFGPVRASQYFIHLDEYIEEAGEEILLAAQIETVEAVRNLEAIMAVEGIDAIFIGRGDLSCSMGLTGQMKHPEVMKVVDEVIGKARAARMPFGVVTGTPEEFADYVARGATFATVGGDLGFVLKSALDCVKQTRELVQRKGVGR